MESLLTEHGRDKLSKREQFRKRLETTVSLLNERQTYPIHDPNFSESDFPTPLFIYNVMFHCNPIPVSAVETYRQQGKSIDDMLVDLYDKIPNPPQTPTETSRNLPSSYGCECNDV
jgi:hypothetical protein